MLLSGFGRQSDCVRTAPHCITTQTHHRTACEPHFYTSYPIPSQSSQSSAAPGLTYGCLTPSTATTSLEEALAAGLEVGASHLRPISMAQQNIMSHIISYCIVPSRLVSSRIMSRHFVSLVSYRVVSSHVVSYGIVLYRMYHPRNVSLAYAHRLVRWAIVPGQLLPRANVPCRHDEA